jgi:sortase A
MTRRRRILRTLSAVLMTAGVLGLADAALTLLWQEPVTALRAKLWQDDLAGRLRAVERAGPTPEELRLLARTGGSGRARVAALARSWQRRSSEGDAVGRLEIPRLGLSTVVVKGTQPADLRRGPGTFERAPFPGAPGTAAIAGHRTTYGAPFRDVDQLRPGDAVTLVMPYATLRYRVEGRRIVEPGDLSVLRRVGHDRLILSACHPRFSASKRIIVFARLSAVDPTKIRQSANLLKTRAERPMKKA